MKLFVIIPFLLCMVQITAAQTSQTSLTREQRIQNHHARIERIISFHRITREIRNTHRFDATTWLAVTGTTKTMELVLQKSGFAPGEIAHFFNLQGQVLELAQADGASTSPIIKDKIAIIIGEQEKIFDRAKLRKAELAYEATRPKTPASAITSLRSSWRYRLFTGIANLAGKSDTGVGKNVRSYASRQASELVRNAMKATPTPVVRK